MTRHGILITLSAKRLSQLEAEPETLEDVVDARDETVIPGLLDLGNAWDALDVLLSDRGEHAVLGDAVLARTGEEFEGTELHDVRVIAPARVVEVARALALLPAKLVSDRYRQLAAKRVHGGLGNDPDEIEGLELLLRRVIALYQEAAQKQHSMLALRV
jgi:hypothetical protein